MPSSFQLCYKSINITNNYKEQSGRFYGGNGSGKSSYSGTFTAVGYRVVNLTDPNAANINRILGPVEIGQCTIVSDETGAIDKHQLKHSDDNDNNNEERRP